jgi:hypothetical protein
MGDWGRVVPNPDEYLFWDSSTRARRSRSCWVGKPSRRPRGECWRVLISSIPIEVRKLSPTRSLWNGAQRSGRVRGGTDMMRPPKYQRPAPFQPRVSRVNAPVSPPEKRFRGEPAQRKSARCQVGVRLVGHVAPIGLSLLITTGFIAALGLSSRLSVLTPNVIATCAAVFVWSLLLSSCVTGSRQ